MKKCRKKMQDDFSATPRGNVIKLSVKASTDLALAVLPLNPLKGTLPFLDGYKCESKSPLGDLGVKKAGRKFGKSRVSTLT
jgi:hypothetical protein